MINKREKMNLELEELIKKLDLTPAMYNNAIEKYKALGEFFLANDERIIFYPQGSFVLGTTVRPYAEQKDRDYDLDAICLYNLVSSEVRPKEIRECVEHILKLSEVYKPKLKFFDRCITIEYANYGTLGFSIDVVPATNETLEKKQEMMKNGCLYEYASTAIDISSKTNNDAYRWISSNPKAYSKWFQNINAPFAENLKINRMRKIYEAHKDIYSSVEEVPEYFNKSSLQMAIQLLKRSRDVYFSKIKKENLKPISAIITTIVLDTAQRMIPNNADLIDVIKIVLEELKIYSQYQFLKEDEFRNLYDSKVIISRKNSKWEMWNPVNPNDNLVDMWNINPECAKLFFEWVSVLEKTLIEILKDENLEYSRDIGNLIGNEIVEQYYKLETPKIINEGPRPWRI